MRTWLLSLALIPSLARGQNIWYVDDDAAGPGTGSLQDPYPTILAAIQSPTTEDGDTIRVRPGDYVESFDLSGRSLRLQAMGTPQQTTISPPGLSRVFDLGGCHFHLEGFTITGGRVLPAYHEGGGIRQQSGTLTLANCILHDNGATHGYAIANRDGVLELIGCEFYGNLLPLGGTSGGGTVWLTGSAEATIRSCIFRDTSSTGTGGLRALTGTTFLLEDCLFENLRNNHWTQHSSGGAVRTGGESITRRCVFKSCSSEAVGGGWYGGGWLEDCIFEDCSVDYGYGGSVAGSGAMTLVNCEIRGSHGSTCGGPAAVHNAHLIGCLIEESRAYASGSTVSYSTLEGCTIRNNHSLGTSTVCDPYGAGLSGCVATDCLIENNTVEVFEDYLDVRGGGARYSTLTDCVLRGNVVLTANSDSLGGGAFQCTLTRCVVEHNAAAASGGVHDCTLDRCTLVGNASLGSGPTIVDSHLSNSIVWGAPNQIDASSTVEWSTVEGGALGTGNQAADPRFWGLSYGDYRLRPDSPCIQAGSLAGAGGLAQRVDQGAFPFDSRYCGEAYVFCEQDVPATCPVELTAVGLSLHVSQLPPEVLLFLRWSQSQIEVLVPEGTLCVASPSQHTPLLLSSSEFGCGATANFHLSLDYFLGNGALSGDSVIAQVIYRDPTGGLKLGPAALLPLCD